MGFGVKQADVAAIKVKTDALPTDPADESELEAAIATRAEPGDPMALTGAEEALITAIKAKTDTLPTAPADDATVAKEATVSAGFTAGAKDATVAKEATSTAIKAKTDALPTDPADESLLEAAIAAVATIIGTEGGLALANKLTAARAALLDQITAARLAELDPANIPADTDPRVMGRLQIKEVAITSPANAGDILVATATTQPCLIECVIIHANSAQTANMTSCGVFGGAGKVITFISALDAVQANLDAADKQVAWTGAVRLAATKTIVISLVGTGPAAVDLTMVIAYRASVSGGYLA